MLTIPVHDFKAPWHERRIDEEEAMLAIAALVSAVATLVVALAAVYLIVKLAQVVDLLSDELKRSKDG